MKAEQLRRSFLHGSDVLVGGQGEEPHRTLITDEPWDQYHLESLLPLKETYRESTEFGFLLRHYWIPATQLTFRQSSRMTLPDGRTDWVELEIERKMARCRSSECLWREKIRPVVGANGKGEHSATSEMLCSYDCYEHAFHTAKPILFAPPTPDQKTEARRQALYRLPMLSPPGPVPIGFSWYGKVGDDYMNYRLDTEEQVGETSVLVIRREGRYATRLQIPQEPADGETKRIPVVIERKGVTLFAWNRAVVLEDRFTDHLVQGHNDLASILGMTKQVVTRLIRSCPEKLAEPAMKKPENEAAADCVGCKRED